MFDGTGSPPARADVVVQDGIILEVGIGLDGDVEIPIPGQTLLPGFIDSHVHVVIEGIDLLRRLKMPPGYRYYVAASNLARLLDIGITTARDAAGADMAIKQALIDGRIPGPRLQIAIQMLSQTGGHADGWHPSEVYVPDIDQPPGMPTGVVDGPENVRTRVRSLIRSGADVIKIASSGGVMSPRSDPRLAQFQPEELEMAVREALAAGLDVMAHAQGTQGIKNAVLAGVRSIEHGVYLDEEAAELMVKRGTFLVPTLLAPVSVLAATAEGAAVGDAVQNKINTVVEAQRASFRLAVAAGVPIAMGTDAIGFPMGRNLEELELMAAQGFTPAAALVAATSSAARLLRLDAEIGTIEPSKRADLVVLEGDPYDFAGLASRISAVYQDGERVGPRVRADRFGGEQAPSVVQPH